MWGVLGRGKEISMGFREGVIEGEESVGVSAAAAGAAAAAMVAGRRVRLGGIETD